jgi:asparagine synthase (glutamine-hydrolysing)
VASMVATGHRPAQTYCIGFVGDGMADEGFEDLAYARLVADHVKVPLSEVEIEANQLLDGLLGLASLVDEPTADPAPILVAAIAQRARHDKIKVLLSGVGGDDIFSGYRRHLTARMRERLGPWRGAVAAASAVAGTLGGGAVCRRAGKLSQLLGESDNDAFLVNSFRTNSVADTMALLRAPAEPSGSLEFDNALTEALEESRGQALLDRMLYMELFGFLPDHNLNYTDKACMAWGIEGRVPLIDRRLIHYMSSVSPALKTKGHDLKWFFKRAVEARIPPQVLTRTKVGFGAPIRALLTHGRGRRLMEDALFASPLVRQLFVRERLECFWQATREGACDGVYAALAIAMIGWSGRTLQETPEAAACEIAV